MEQRSNPMLRLQLLRDIAAAKDRVFDAAVNADERGQLADAPNLMKAIAIWRSLEDEKDGIDRGTP
jgi:hypothetical protein